MLTQVYDKDFNFLGIHLEDSIFTNITFNPEGDIVVSDKKNDYISYLVALKEPQIFEIMNIDSKLSKKELSLSTQPAKSESLPFDYRLYTYIQSLTEDYLEKVIFLNTDEMCFDCVDYILKHWNDNFGGSQKYRIVVFGTEKQFAIEMLTKYDIDIGNQVVIDTENTYLDLFKNVELQKVPMFHLTPTGPVLFPYSNLDLIKQFEKFVEN
jgi:hypothetical protein